MSMVNIGRDSFINSDFVCAIAKYTNSSETSKSIRAEAESRNSFYNLTFGKKPRSMIVFSNGAVALSNMSSRAIANKLNREVFKTAPSIPETDDYVEDIEETLADTNIAPRTKISRNYNHKIKRRKE